MKIELKKIIEKIFKKRDACLHKWKQGHSSLGKTDPNNSILTYHEDVYRCKKCNIEISPSDYFQIKTSHQQTLLTVILIIVTLFYTWFTLHMSDTMKEQLRLNTQQNEQTNRPYVAILAPVIEFYDEKGERLGDVSSYLVHEIKYIKFVGRKENHGNIPAEIVEEKIEVKQLDVSSTTYDISFIYNYVLTPTGLIPIPNGIDSFFDSFENNIIFNSSVKYKIPSSDKVFEQSNESNCSLDKTNNILSINCYTISETGN